MFDTPSVQLLCATVMTLMKLGAISFKHYYLVVFIKKTEKDRADGLESGRSAASTEVINILPPGTYDKDKAVNPGGIMSKHVYCLKLLTGYCMHPGDGGCLDVWMSTFLDVVSRYI